MEPAPLLEKSCVLKNGHIISFGENHMVVGVLVDKFMTQQMQAAAAESGLPPSS
jgi:hypothetical protein